jgi:very-short-patch-repair endonuclease
MKTIKTICNTCGDTVIKPLKEYTRSIKRGRMFYCNNSCAAVFGNRSKIKPIVEKLCLNCGSKFTTKSDNKESTYCSRECASTHSYYQSDIRQSAAKLQGFLHKENLSKPHETLKKREAWKYVELKDRLKSVEHEFEFLLGDFVYDLMIYDRKLLIEFDAKDHDTYTQRNIDRLKEELARQAGYQLVRISVESSTVIPGNFIDFLDIHYK